MSPFKGKKNKVKGLNPKKLLKHCSAAILFFCLTGCMGVYEGGFECSAGVGVGCKSITDVNHMINKGEIPKKKQNDFSDADCKDCEPRHFHSRFQNIESQIWYAPSERAQGARGVKI